MNPRLTEKARFVKSWALDQCTFAFRLEMAGPEFGGKGINK